MDTKDRQETVLPVPIFHNVLLQIGRKRFRRRLQRFFQALQQHSRLDYCTKGPPPRSTLPPTTTTGQVHCSCVTSQRFPTSLVRFRTRLHCKTVPVPISNLQERTVSNVADLRSSQKQLTLDRYQYFECRFDFSFPPSILFRPTVQRWPSPSSAVVEPRG